MRRARLGAANLDGASLRGARLDEAESESGASFVGTDLSDADLTRSELWGLDDVALAGADLYFARLYFTGLPQWDGETLAFGRLFFDPDLGPLDLSGLDLTDVTVRAERGDDRLVIADLSNAIVEDLSLMGVDLTGARMDGVDISLIEFNDASICPDGSEPAGDGIFDRTCG